VNLGFVGAGAIVEAFIVGMFEKQAFDGEVIISHRSESRSAMLAGKFEQVTVCDQNQSIVDQSDWVLLGVLPEQAEAVLDELTFRPDQQLFSMVAGISLSRLTELTTLTKVHRIIPMPPIEFGFGPIVITPPNRQFATLCQAMGTPINLESEDQFSTLSASSAIMASFFELVASHARWMESFGIPEPVAADYATSLSRALAEMTCRVDHEGLQNMAEECLTIGGLNEQVLRESKRDQWFTQMHHRLDRIADRLSLKKPV